MQQQVIPVNENTVLEIRGHADLRLTGWDRPEVSLDADPSSLRLDQGQNLLAISCLDDCEVFVPIKNKVLVTKIGGDARITNLPTELSIEKVSGNLTLQQVAAVRIHKVGGNCQVQGASGPVAIEKVGGNFDGQDLPNGIELDSVGGNISGAGIKRTASGRAGGNIRLSLEELAQGALQFRAGGNISLYLPGLTNGVFNLSSGGQDIQVTLAGRSERFNRREYALSLGKGGPDFTLRAGGRIKVSDQPNENEPEISFGKSDWEERLEERIRARVEFADRSEEWSERVNQTVTEALRRAEDRIQAAMQRVEREWPDWGSNSSSVPFQQVPPQTPVSPASTEPPVPPTPASNVVATEAKSEGVSDEERLLILRMLQEKKITVEQAEALMDELEDQGNEANTGKDEDDSVSGI